MVKRVLAHFVDEAGIHRAPVLLGLGDRKLRASVGEYSVIHVECCEPVDGRSSDDPAIQLQEVVPALQEVVDEDVLDLALTLLQGQYLLGAWPELALKAHQAGIIHGHILRLGVADGPEFRGIVKGYYAAVAVEPLLLSMWLGWAELDAGMLGTLSATQIGPEYIEPLVVAGAAPQRLSAVGLLAVADYWTGQNCVHVALDARERLATYESEVADALSVTTHPLLIPPSSARRRGGCNC